NMENFDPLGIHTGESIVVAPSQTLNNDEYHKLRELSIRVIRHFKIVGECNVQFAIDQASDDYRVIEVNARLSRSSALASKATGYPLAFIAAKLAIGYSLTELQNSITKKTSACFEPALDYVVVKIPRWDLQKFRNVSKRIGTEMKSVGEVMAIGKNFGEAMQKAVRMLQIGMFGLVGNKVYFEELSESLKYPTSDRIFAVVNAIEGGERIEKIHALTKIDKWFLHKLREVVELKKEIEKNSAKTISKELLLLAKKLGFSDKQLAVLLGEKDELAIRQLREKFGVTPFVKQIDTLSAEFPAKTNYLYVTYNSIEDDVEFSEKNSVMVLGCGAYRIGSSVEFDWCSVFCAKELRKLGFQTIMVNYNPETVSTDYDVCDRLYFDELSFEMVLDIYKKENPLGMILSVGGQIPNNLAMKCSSVGLKIFGTSPQSIDTAEDRHKFSSLCDRLSISQPEWKEFSELDDALKFSKKVGFPVLVRPSYVLSGSAMNVAFTEDELKEYLSRAVSVSQEYPVVVSKFILNAREIEIDAVAFGGKLVCHAVNEHIENAGTHSGDATMVLPPQKTYIETIRKIKLVAASLAKELRISGPFNIQFIAKDNEVKVIECNLRASRSFPFVSKVTGTNFIEIATRAMLGKPVKNNFVNALDLDHVGVKAPQFSFSRLQGADPISGVEMASTGEVGCLGCDFEDAFLKAILSTEFLWPKKGIVLSISGEENRFKLLDEVKSIEGIGHKIFCTDDTFKFFSLHGVKCELIHKLDEKASPNIYDFLQKQKIDLVVSIPNPLKQISLDKNYDLRRATVDHNVALITNVQLAKAFFHSIAQKTIESLEIKAFEEYVQ
ncbi:MAG: carbamoyl-phosphate synthase (glutamine-hydrolyzing) large subunit, partial [Candidatus Diapherotrites archaeon]|nr:carbamoyl-phosphate synthase (glutamine-hydrolyzing) large subunit [Candidatus Diapherotrites archaeon]